MNSQFVCKIASLEEFTRKWAIEIQRHPGDNNWRVWRIEALHRFLTGRSVPYYGFLDGTAVCEATALLDPATVQNGAGMMEEHTVYLCAFRTEEPFRGKGYFSRLLTFLQDDLKRKGYTKAVLGVEPGAADNKAMYQHWGFTELIKTATETDPDGAVTTVEYYGKRL